MGSSGGLDVDHITHGSMTHIDNRISNLRFATRSQNCMNTRIKKTNTSGVTGVSFRKDRGMWRARMRVDGIDTQLGYFKEKSDAINARKLAEIKYQGEYSFNS